MYIFGDGLIKCLNCSGKYRGKQNRSKKIYICSTYSKSSSKCTRYVIDEEFLIYTTKKHLSLKGLNVEDSNLTYYIKSIEVKGRSYTIFYKDNTTSFINDEDGIGHKLHF